MNGFTPDRPQRMAQMLAMQERNRSIGAPAGQRDGMPAMQPSMAYAGASPNAAPGVSPSAMNFNGPQVTPQPGMGGMAMEGPPGRVGGAMMPQISTAARRPASPGLTTPQGGRYRGDFDGD